MALNFSGRGTGLFPQSERDNLGIGAKGNESFWSCPGTNFVRRDEGDNWGFSTFGGTVTSTTAGIILACPVFLPDGSQITGAVVFGSDGTNIWELRKVTLTTGTESIISSATVNVNTEEIKG